MESSPECAFSLTTTFSTQSSEPPPTPPNYLRTLELWERRWALAPNIQKCHRLTVANKNNRIPISYILHNQTLETVAMAKYRGVELTENLHPGKHILCTAAKANRVSAFAYANPRGCPSAVQTHCYTGPVRPVLENTSVMWGHYRRVGTRTALYIWIFVERRRNCWLWTSGHQDLC